MRVLGFGGHDQHTMCQIRRCRWCWVLLFLLPQTLFAFSWQDLWLRPDQQAAQLLAIKKNQQAAQRFVNPAWKGVAYYQDKKYKQAAHYFKSLDSALGDYNLGNALAYQHQYMQAIKAYEAALKKQPNYPGAQHNIEILKKWLQQQKKPQQKHHSTSRQQDNKKQSAKSQNKRQQKKNAESLPGQKKRSSQPQQKQADQSRSKKQQKQSQQQSKATAKHQATQQAQQKKAQLQPAKQKKVQHSQQPMTAQQQTHQKTRLTAAQKKARLQTQQIKHWLSQIPNHPGGLLREKFLQEYQRRQQQGESL